MQNTHNMLQLSEDLYRLVTPLLNCLFYLKVFFFISCCQIEFYPHGLTDPRAFWIAIKKNILLTFNLNRLILLNLWKVHVCLSLCLQLHLRSWFWVSQRNILNAFDGEPKVNFKIIIVIFKQIQFGVFGTSKHHG